jgi:protein-disulfide isomerase
VLEQVLEKYPEKVNLVLKHYPLPMHKAAMPAATAALSAEKQGKYREMSEILFKNSKSLNRNTIKEYAQQAGLDMAVYEKDLRSPEIRNMVAQDTRDARKFRVRGVPAVFINGRTVKGRSLEDFERVIKKELENVQ